MGIDASGDADADAEAAVPFNPAAGEELPDRLADLDDRLFLVLEDEGEVLLEGDDVPLEIGDDDAGVGMPDIDAGEETGVRVQPVDARPASAGSPVFPEIDHEAFVDQLVDELGDGRDAVLQLGGQGGDAVFAVVDAETEDILLHQGRLVLFLVEEGISHNQSYFPSANLENFLYKSKQIWNSVKN